MSPHWLVKCKTFSSDFFSAGLKPIEARGNYVPEPPYLRETTTYHSQPLESIHVGNYFVPISIRPIFIFCCCRSYVKLLDYWQAENFFSTSGGPSEAWDPWHLAHLPHGSGFVAFFQTLEALKRASCGLSSVALKRTGCDVWQLECQASNVTASVHCSE